MLISVRINKNFLTTKFKEFPTCDLNNRFPIDFLGKKKFDFQ